MTQVGDIIERDGRRYRVARIDRVLTPYRKKNQDTRVEGETLGLRNVGGVACSCEEPDFPEVAGRDLAVTSKANVECRKCGHRRWG